jgi:hypothetical protein
MTGAAALPYHLVPIIEPVTSSLTRQTSNLPVLVSCSFTTSTSSLIAVDASDPLWKRVLNL